MINWRNGLAGFVGASKHFIKGFFSPVHSVPAAVVATEDSTFGVFGLIQERGKGVTGTITESLGVTGTITDTFGQYGMIQERGKGVTGTIDEDGQGVTGTI